VRKDTSNVKLNDAGFYDEVEIEDMEWNEDNQAYYWPCPCGDKFVIFKVCFLALSLSLFKDQIVSYSLNPVLFLQEDLMNGEVVAKCPSCTLKIRVIYDPVRFVSLVFLFSLFYLPSSIFPLQFQEDFMEEDEDEEEEDS
jgi:diphthamide biosynthesis protein 3